MEIEKRLRDLLGVDENGDLPEPLELPEVCEEEIGQFLKNLGSRLTRAEIEKHYDDPNRIVRVNI